MSEVLLKLKDHYVHVHRVMMLEDDFKDMHVPPEAAAVCGGRITKKKLINPIVKRVSSSSNDAMNCTTTTPKSKTELWPLPQIPLPLPMSAALSKSAPSLAPPPIVLSSIAHLKNSNSSSGGGIPSSIQMTAVLASNATSNTNSNIADDKNSEEDSKEWSASGSVEMMQEDNEYNNHQTDKDQPPTTCTAKILALRRGDLLVFGTSILRPEAALHKVHNSSRKPKHVVIDELWKHYVDFHPKELMDSSNSAPGWVGSVKDDDDDDR